MACCNKRVNQNHMKILSIILALFATSFAVHAQTYTKAELTQAAYNIQQGHNEGAKICLTYKAQVEASKAWTEEIRRNYLFAIQSLLEYYSMQKRYTDEDTDDEVTKAIEIADGVCADVNSLVTLTKKKA